MRLVIVVSGCVVNYRDSGRKFARVVASLVHDGHAVTLIHGKYDCDKYSSCAGDKAILGRNGNHSTAGKRSPVASLAAAGFDNRVLVNIPTKANIESLGLCASDLGLLHLRKRPSEDPNGAPLMEAAALNSHWLNIICGNKGVPVLSNACLCICGTYHLIDPDQMAAICAIDWDADALICLTDENGVLDRDGTVVRWLDIDSIIALQRDSASDRMRKRLGFCALTVRKGVRRVKILPVAHIECLADFYSAPIKYGTELICAPQSI